MTVTISKEGPGWVQEEERSFQRQDSSQPLPLPLIGIRVPRPQAQARVAKAPQPLPAIDHLRTHAHTVSTPQVSFLRPGTLTGLCTWVKLIPKRETEAFWGLGACVLMARRPLGSRPGARRQHTAAWSLHPPACDENRERPAGTVTARQEHGSQ